MLVASMTYKQLLSHIEEIHTEYCKQREEIDLDTFAEKYLKDLLNKIPETKIWEKEFIQLRVEYGKMNAFNKEEKKLEMMDRLKENPYESLDNIDSDMKDNGLFLSINEKIFLLETKKSYLFRNLGILENRQKE